MTKVRVHWEWSMLRQKFGFLLLAASLGLTDLGSAQTLEEAIRLAHLNNPQIEAERRNAQVAQERLEQARSSRRPRANFAGSAGFESVDSNQPFAFGLGDRALASAQFETTLPVYTGGRIESGIRQAQAGIEVSDARLSGATQTLILDVVTAYVDVARDLEALRIRENSVLLLTEQVRAARDRFEVGVVTRTDVAQAEARLEGARAGLASARAILEASKATYMLLVGEPAGNALLVPEPPTIPAAFETALDQALIANPDLIAARFNEAAAAETIEAARSELRPSVSIRGTAGFQENFNQNFRDTSIAAVAQATIPLYTGGQVASQIRVARLERDRARLQTQALERQVRTQVAQSWYATRAAESSIAASNRQVEAAEIAYQGAQEELSVGVRTTLDVLDQEQQLLDARLNLVAARRDAVVAAHQLRRAMGVLSLDPAGQVSNLQ